LDSQIRVLIAGHDCDFRSKLGKLIASSEKAQVVGEVSSGAQALAMVTSLRPDLVLMDMAVSGANGLMVTRHLKSLRPTIPVVLLTGLDAREYLAVARSSGVDSCLTRREVEHKLLPLIEKLTMPVAL